MDSIVKRWRFDLLIKTHVIDKQPRALVLNLCAQFYEFHKELFPTSFEDATIKVAVDIFSEVWVYQVYFEMVMHLDGNKDVLTEFYMFMKNSLEGAS